MKHVLALCLVLFLAGCNTFGPLAPNLNEIKPIILPTQPISTGDLADGYDRLYRLIEIDNRRKCAVLRASKVQNNVCDKKMGEPRRTVPR